MTGSPDERIGGEASDPMKPIDGVPMVRVLDESGEEVLRGWYVRHERRQLCPFDAECGARNGWGDCNATCPLRMGEYCEDVRKAVEA